MAGLILFTPVFFPAQKDIFQLGWDQIFVSGAAKLSQLTDYLVTEAQHKHSREGKI
jgi:hypothetical protein